MFLIVPFFCIFNHNAFSSILFKLNFNFVFLKDDVLSNDLFEGLNLEDVKEEQPLAKEPSPINSNPSMINKQSNPTADPSIDAKIDLIRKQNDYLFICKSIIYLIFSKYDFLKNISFN